MSSLCCTDFKIRKDHGYAWLVMAACMILNFLNIGFLFGVIGILTDKYTSEFKVDITRSSWVGSTLFLVLFVCGPLAAFIVGKLGVRLVAVISVVGHIVGFGISGFATELWHVILSFAVLSGFACCCTHVCTLKILTVYFEKYQHMVYTASAIGSDLAAVTFPFITSKIMETLSYSHSILALSGLLCLGIPCAVAFLEPEVLSYATNKEERTDNLDEVTKPEQISDATMVLLDTEGLTDTANNNNNKEILEDNDAENYQLYGKTTEPIVEKQEIHRIKDHLILLTTPTIVIYLINCVLWNMGGSVVSVLAYSYYTEHLKLSEDSASLAYTMFGAGSLIGSLLLTIASSMLSINRLYVHFFCNLIMGVFSILFPLVSFNEVGMTTCLAIVGFGYGSICANLGSVIKHLNGSNLLYLVYGYEMAAAGIGSFIGPVVGSKLDQALGTGYAYHYGGASHLLALLIFIIFAIFKRNILTAYPDESVEDTSKPSDNNNEEAERV